MPATRARRRRADPGRRHAAAHARASSPTSSGCFCILPFTRPVARRLLTRFIDPQVPVRSGPAAAAPPDPGTTPRTRQRPGPDDGGPGRGRRLTAVEDGVRRDFGLLLRRPVQVRRADLAAAQQLQALGEDVLELLDRAALEQHVPVGADRLLDLGLRLDAVACSAPRRRSAGTPRPPGRRPRPTSGSRTRAPAGSRSRRAGERRTRCRARPRSSGPRGGRRAVCALP